MNPPPSQAQSLISRRRLLEELERVTMRTVLLVAPAGYGKSTLADQWIERAGGVRLSVTPAARDLPVLVRAVSVAIMQIVPMDVRRIETALLVVKTPIEQARLVGRAILDQLPADVGPWLVVDDYQALMSSRAGEELIATLEASGQLRIMIASRERPSWATSRRFVHLQIVELGAPDLAFDDDEITEILPDSRDSKTLREQARGWPAVIALAAHARSSSVPFTADTLAESLYDYFAEELFSRATPSAQRLLARIALLPRKPSEAIGEFVTEPALLEEVLATGLVQTRNGTVEVHPVARTFLLSKVRDRDDFRELTHSTLGLLLSMCLWDDAFALIRDFELDDCVEFLIATSFSSLIETGRIGTLELFGRYATRNGAVSQYLLDLIAAELALNDGRFDRALALSQSVVACLKDEVPLKTRALIVAGEAARFDHRFDMALAFYSDAARLAMRTSDLRACAWGRCLVALVLESSGVQDTVHEFEVLPDKRPEDRLRLLSARCISASLREGFRELRVDENLAVELLSVVSDPWVRTGWRSVHGYSLMLQGRYKAAKAVLSMAMKDVDEFGLAFARPHLEWTLASAELGLRQMSRCDALLRRVERQGAESADLHLQLNARVLRARVHLAQQEPEAALAAIESDFDAFPSRAMYGEYLATRGVALAVLGDVPAALDAVSRARALTDAVVTQVLAASVDALVAAESPNAALAAEELLATASRLGTWDGVVCAARACRELAGRLVAVPRFRSQLRELLLRSNDVVLARSVGLAVRPNGQHGVLSVREQEVLDLVRVGLKNKQIASILFISPSTVKTHVDSILAKLGARTRAEAVARYSDIAATSVHES